MKNLFKSSCLAFLPFVLVSSASAHLEIGTYEGKDSTGAVCSLRIIDEVFEGDLHHPLTERFVVDYLGKIFKVGHPFIFSAADKKASFDHDHLNASLPFKGGSEGLEIKMDHSEGRDGPSEFHYVSDDYRNDLNDKVSDCYDLVFKP